MKQLIDLLSEVKVKKVVKEQSSFTYDTGFRDALREVKEILSRVSVDEEKVRKITFNFMMDKCEEEGLIKAIASADILKVEE
jgi:hypothetical protein